MRELGGVSTPLSLGFDFGLVRDGDGSEAYGFGLLDPDPGENVYWD